MKTKNDYKDIFCEEDDAVQAPLQEIRKNSSSVSVQKAEISMTDSLRSDNFMEISKGRFQNFWFS